MIGFLRNAFVRGILLILPLAITYLILRSLFRLVHGISSPLVEKLLRWPETTPAVADLLPYLTPVISILLTLTLVLAVGLVGGNFVGRRLLAWFESVLMRVPLVKWLYGSARQLMDAFGAASGGAFREVVFVEYPRRDVWCLGFVTAQASGRLPFDGPASGDDCVYVFLPTTPNPTSGYTVLLKRTELRPAGMTVDEGLKLIVSGGVIAPGTKDRRGSS